MATENKYGPTKVGLIINALIKGGERAVRDFFEVSGGEWFDEAPEYLLTSYAAMSIKNANKAYALLEVSVNQTRKEAGATRRGRPSNDERRNGRFDFVVYWDNGCPRGMVEVKSPIHFDDQNLLNPDFVEICKALNAHSDSSFQFGTFLFYSSVAKPKNTNLHENSSTRIKSLLDKLTGRAKDVAKEHNLEACLVRSSIHSGNDDEDGVWCISAIVFTRKGGASELVSS